MTPQEKALELIDKFTQSSVVSEDDKKFFHEKPFSLAKRCAIITCDEVLGYMGADRGYEFWTRVKSEIEKL